MNKDQTFEEFPPSPVGGKYRKHGEVMEKCDLLSVNKSFAIFGEFDLKMLRVVAEGFKPKKIVVIQHSENEFEVSRLSDFLNVAVFYKSIEQANSEIEIDEKLHKIKKVISEYFSISEKNGMVYDINFLMYRNKSCISYSYLHKKLCGLSLFRKDPDGPSNALKKTLAKAIEEGLIELLENANEIFGNNATLYKILKKD